MSAQDFQAKFASVMESILQSAIAETTKLFEAMVDELKADMSRIKKDNDDLKAKCSQFEFAKKDAIAGNCQSEKRHTAVQCDIISFCNKMAEPSQALVPNQRSHQETFYPLQEHDYGVRGRGGTVSHESVLRQQEVSAAYSGDVLHEEAESPQASQSETGSEGGSTRTRELSQELPRLGIFKNLQRGQNRDAILPNSGPPTSVRCGRPPNSTQIVNTSQASSLQPRKRYTSVTLQDAKLLVEAMSSSMERSVFPSQQRKAAKSVCGPRVGALPTAGRAIADLQILPHSSESPKAVHSLVIKEFVAAKSRQESVNVTQPSETESQVRASSAATSAAVQPRGSSALKISIPNNEERRVTQKIIIMPRPTVSLESCDRAAQRSTLSAAARKVNTARNTGQVQTTPVPTGGALTSSVPGKTPLISSKTSQPTYVGQPSGPQKRPTIKIVFPAQPTVGVKVLKVPELDKSGGRDDHLPSQEAMLSLESPTPPDVEPTESQVQKENSESCSSSNSSAALKLPAACHVKPFAVVRLTRLPFYMSTEESVLISKLPLSPGWDGYPVLNQDTGSSRPPSESPPVITADNNGASSLSGSPSASLSQDEVTSESLQPVEQETSSKGQEKDSTSYKETENIEKRWSTEPHLEVESTSYHHAETQTVSQKKLQKDQQDSKIKLDLPEIAKAVSFLRTNEDSSIQTRKSALAHDVTGPPASRETDPDDDISSSERGTDIPDTTYCTSPVRNVTTRNTKPGFRPSDTNATPRSLKRTRSSPDAGPPKRAKSAIISKRSGSSKDSSKPEARAAESASMLHGMCPSVQLGSPVDESEKRSDSSGRRQNDGCDTKFKSTVKKPRIVQAEMAPKRNLRVVNAKKLAKKAKAKLVKIKAAHRLQRRARKTRLEANPPSSVAVKKIRSTGVWIPPVGDAAENEPGYASLKTETTSPKAPDPPRAVVQPSPVQPVVSPLQPLSLIGTRLLKNQCGMCGQVLGSSSALESHVSLHSRRPFSCRLCGKSFTDTKALKRHDRVHRNGKIHVCQKCGKAFVYKFSLTKHLEMVHRRIKPFVCQICNKSFFTKLDVESHIRIHTGEKPFHCNLCERKFIRRVDLNVHLRWHNGEKRHWCPYCKKGFLDFNNLKRHKYIHTGEKPHPCTHCSKHFTQSAHLKKHLKNVHKITGGS